MANATINVDFPVHNTTSCTVANCPSCGYFTGRLVTTSPSFVNTWTYSTPATRECTEIAHVTLPYDLIYAAFKHFSAIEHVDTRRALGAFLDEAKALIETAKP